MDQVDITKRRIDVGVTFTDTEGELWDEEASAFEDTKALEAIVDRDLDQFAEFYSKTLGNGSLSGFERAVIKTYLHWKMFPEKK